ncbi:ankyrin repeat-containing domain-containing protein [Pochonia chlamydosporia 170]|uniref:Ankyrin repeat-containing domain-containing protein n=1 Tax=Pochonia chlamydosporia 170 TaxID=1380566 RepID=A0A179G879_METCM|nr:ankyrin repeat-containing domain-containing protein [Pochonia chlamydosporia 170]OAQ73603.1 ankyrin repeat-containing domain-containing protein [Pochonia chlamydosporia 170]
MNRFRNKKKGRDDNSIGGRPSIDTEPSGPFRMFGKKKTQDDEPKKEIDLAAALPPSDDFRTSLLMTGLSARFSMLREQDDPNSKLGKASDDSVLFPKRQSRLADLGGFGAGLDDIAEIESLKAPRMGRFDPYQSDDASSTTGSIMGRSKPTEGNNLFGGRQKIYKLTAGSKAGMTGRALYDDDVAQSSFQKWRQAEKERKSMEEDRNNDALDAESTLNYNRRRETSSTTSSVPSGARNSTAATSIASQPSSIKDSQSSNHLAGLERSVTRTRRLYEQGLNQDLHDQQSSAVSRMDTLSRQRPFGSRTPDPMSSITSPTNTAFGDRSSDRRPILSKASAPNLRSFSPSMMTSAQTSPADSTSKFTRQESKPSFVASPPLSPPISEHEEHPALAIQPNDRGKATAMGVFNRPAMQYDESRYAQRQRQLQQGRDPSTSSTFFDDSDDGSLDNRVIPPAATPQLTIERPDDHDHPAFRKSALPTPLSLTSPKDSEDGDSLSPASRTEPPEDSPTLGPNAGLSGMVRQHLRHDSNASSVYGPMNHEVESGDTESRAVLPVRNGVHDVTDESTADLDDFAQHLADGARRVRERLTTYVESDHERSAPPTPPQSDHNKELATSRSGGLGMLRSKSSRGSLFEKAERERGRSKTLKSSGSPPNTLGTSPSPRKASSSRAGSRNGEIASKPSEASPVEKEENVHVGLKAFRQARRELQKMKELEVQQRHTQKPGPGQERPPNSRVASYENGPPPAIFNRMPRDGESYGSRSRAGSRAASERERSGSEASNGGRAYSRGPRLRNGSATFEEHYGRPGVNGSPGPDLRRQPMESPGMSPYMASGHSPVGMSPSHSVGGFEAPGRYYPPGMQSPQQPDSAPYSRSRSGSLLGAAASTPNLHGSAAAPPLPPINPRRKNGFPRQGDEAPGLHHHNGPYAAGDGYAGDDDGSPELYRGRMPMKGPPRQSPPRIVRPGMPPSNMSSASLPGGMI